MPPFEMRRMEALSNTIFGVAMTLLAYQVPKERFDSSNPKWIEIWHVYGAHLSALLLSFIVAGMFWYSHQRRLSYAPQASRIEVFGNLVFLLSIILLPVTTGLYGSYVDAGDVTLLYSLNLMLIALLNTLLWVIASVPRRDWLALVAPLFSASVFVVALAVAIAEPWFTRMIWPLAFLAPVLAAIIERRKSRNAAADEQPRST